MYLLEREGIFKIYNDSSWNKFFWKKYFDEYKTQFYGQIISVIHRFAFLHLQTMIFSFELKRMSFMDIKLMQSFLVYLVSQANPPSGTLLVLPDRTTSYHYSIL